MPKLNKDEQLLALNVINYVLSESNKLMDLIIENKQITQELKKMSKQMNKFVNKSENNKGKNK